MFEKFLDGVLFGIGFLFIGLFTLSVFAFVAPGSAPSVNYYVDTSSSLMGNLTNMSGEIYVSIPNVTYSGTTQGGSHPTQSCFTGWSPVANTTFSVVGGRRDSDGATYWMDWTYTTCRLD